MRHKYPIIIVLKKNTEFYANHKKIKNIFSSFITLMTYSLKNNEFLKRGKKITVIIFLIIDLPQLHT